MAVDRDCVTHNTVAIQMQQTTVAHIRDSYLMWVQTGFDFRHSVMKSFRNRPSDRMFLMVLSKRMTHASLRRKYKIRKQVNGAYAALSKAATLQKNASIIDVASSFL